MLASIGYAGFWTYYMNTGDDAAIEAAYPAVKKYLGLWQRSNDGLVQHRGSDPSWATWADWGNNVDSTVLENIWYYMALDGVARMADVLGQTSDATTYPGGAGTKRVAGAPGSRPRASGKAAPGAWGLEPGVWSLCQPA
jgi:alpha-L-rhamnosidase